MATKGIISAMLTPFHQNQAIDKTSIRVQVNRLIKEGVHGLFILGTNGEFFSLSTEEKVSIAEIVVDEVNGRIPVWAGTGAISTQEVINLTKKMEQVGVDAISVLTPYLMTLSQKELLNHYRKIADSTSLPIIIYHMPQRTNNMLTPETVAQLNKIDNIVGIKDSSGDLELIQKYIDATDDNFSVYAGTDSLILKTLLAGGAGAVAATSNMVPSLVVSIYNHWINGHLEKAHQAQEKLMLLREASSMASIPAVFKKAMELLGYPVGPPRAPIEEVSVEIEQKVKKILEQYIE